MALATYCKDFAGQDPRICIIRGTHEGVAAARNRGLAQARGSIVICMDDDDIAMPERIELQLAYLTGHPDVAAVGSALRLINKDGDPLALQAASASHPAPM